MAQRVLVVDDDRSIVKVFSGYLEQSGYQVIPAYDGEMALHTLRRERPDLVILDLMMPNRDGWEVTNLVRADPPGYHAHHHAHRPRRGHRQNRRSGTGRG